MAKLLQTTITGSLNISGSSLVMPVLTGSTDVFSGSAGQLWINSENGLNLTLAQFGSYGSQNSPFTCLGAFRAGGNLNFSQRQAGSGGTGNAGIIAGGYNVPTGNTSCTQEYDGMSWAAGGNLINARSLVEGTGPQNAFLVAGGYTSGNTYLQSTEHYDGQAWASGGNRNNPVGVGAMGGFQNSAFYMGGDCGSSPYKSNATEKYDGEAWANSTDYPINTRGNLFVGHPEAGLGFGCGDGVDLNTYEWDGSAFSATSKNMLQMSFGTAIGSESGGGNTAIGLTGCAAPGAFGSTKSQEWNGHTWSIGNTTLYPTFQSSGAGNAQTGNGFIASGRSAYPTNDTTTCVQHYEKNLVAPFTYKASPSTDSWSGGPNMIVGRNSNMAAGTPSSGITFGGQCQGGSSRLTCTEEFDGSAFAAGGALINANGAAGSAGTQNAALMAGGLVPPAYKNITEEYNGSAWSAGNAIITTRGYIAAWGGTQNAAYIAGGYSPGVLTCTEEYDGTNWATGGALSVATYLATGGGTQNAGIMAGGTQPGSSAYYSTSYHYDGSSWSSGGAMSTARGYQVGGGLQDDMTVGGGLTPSYTPATERYNGVSWCNVTAQPYNTYLNQSAPQSGGSNMLAFGGYTPSPAAGFSAQTLFYCEATDIDSSIAYCLGSWSTTAATITARAFSAGGGTKDAAFFAGGYQPSSPNRVACNEEYNGSAFSAGGALIQSRSSNAGGGTQNAGIVFAGTPDGSNGLGCTEEYDGSSFSSGGNMITPRHGGAGGGSQNAGIYTLGYHPPTSQNVTEHYDGSSWSATNSANSIRSETSYNGTQTSGLLVGGQTGAGRVSCVEKYNGTTWSNSTALPTAAAGKMTAGTQNASMAAGGESDTTGVYEWNGVAWATRQSQNIGRMYGPIGSQGTRDAFVWASGRTPSYVTCAEEWNCNTAGSSIKRVWAAGPMINCGRSHAGGFGDADNSLIAGGELPSPIVDKAESYDGAAWSIMTSIPSAMDNPAGSGTQNAGYIVGGYPSNPTAQFWDGSTWSSNTSGVAGYYAQAAGSVNAALAWSGYPTNVTTREYDGVSWTAGGNLIAGRYGAGGAGTQNSAATVAGTPAGISQEHYDGTSWSSANNFLYDNSYFGMNGANNDCFSTYGGLDSPSGTSINCTSVWNGITFQKDENTVIRFRLAGGAGGNQGGGGFLAAGNHGVDECQHTYTVNIYSNPVNKGLYCFFRNIAPGTSDSSGTSYSTGY